MRPLSGPVLTAVEMRAAEVASNIGMDVLMERAGAALADAVVRFGHGCAVLVTCGPGNNGGDGYVAARLLRDRGVAVTVAATGQPTTDLAIAARARWSGDVTTLAAASVVPIFVDCVFGTGLTRAIDAGLAQQLGRLAQGAFVIAADVPSGVGTDDGAGRGAVVADVTVAFGAAKPAHLLHPAAADCGTVLVVDLGFECNADVEVLAKPRLAAPGPHDHKYSRGMVAVVPGAMPGAATLGATAAAHLAGYTILCGNGAAPHAVVRRGFEAALADPRLDALLIGPGLSDTPDNRRKLAAALSSNAPLVLDAGALALVTPDTLRRAAPTIVTPHAGEFDRLFGTSGGSKIERTRQAASISGATVVHKGADTVIASPDGRVTLAPAASPWLASAGTGDVLAGITTAKLARHEAHAAACAAVWLHGDAARRAGAAFTADDLCDHIGAAMAAATQ